MGSLAGQYISQSYQSLVHLGSDSTISSSYTDLQDGLGNSLNISVNAQGDISASGNIYAANLASLTYDTGSLLTTASVNLNVLTFTKGNGSTFNLSVTSSVPAGTVSGSSQIAALGFISSSVTSSMAVSSSLYATTASLALTASLAVTASYAQTASVSRNVVVPAINANQSTLGAGSVVRITGANGDNPQFNTASWTNDANSANTLGILNSSVAPGAYGNVTVIGVVTGVNTDPALGYAAGDVLYLSSSGQFTNVQPQAPLHIVTLGEVLRVQQNNGSIFVNVSNGWELNELHNVRITSAQQGDVLVYEASSSLWKNVPSSSIAGGTTDISALNAFTASVAGTNAFTASADQRLDSIEAVSGSWVTSAITASSLVTASVNVNVITFTKGNGTTFDLAIAASGSVTPGTISGSAQISALGFVTSAVTASSLVTASFSGNTLSFTKGDGSTFGVQIPDVSGSTINTGSFATTGSNNFIGTETITGQLNVTGSASFTGSINVLSGSASGSVITNVGDTFSGSAVISKIISLSSAEYSALTPKDPNTLYIIA